jgi:hypothetical protein
VKSKLAKDVEAWLAALGEPPQQAMRRVVEIILGADERMSVGVKYWTLVFAGGGADCCSFVQWKKKTPVSLMFNRGGSIQGDFPHLEGEGPNARFMRFADLAEVNARAKELGKIAVAWCEWMEAAPKAKPKPPKSKLAKAKKR